MLHGGFGTLTFFGIYNRSARNNITTKKIVTKEEITERKTPYVRGYGAYETVYYHTATNSRPIAWEDTYTCSSTYYDSNGDFCGTSQSSGTDKELHTIYYDANGCRCGTSTSGLNGYFETTYYNTDGRPCGTSTGRGYDTTYYLPDGREWDTSKSDSSGNTTYATPRQIAEREERERAEREAIAERERIAARERRERSEREARDKAERERIKANEAFEREKRAREAPVPPNAISNYVRSLSDPDLTRKAQALSSLLILAEPYRDSHGHLVQRAGFLEQITTALLPLLNVMREITPQINIHNGVLEPSSELSSYLKLFSLLPFESKAVKPIVLKSEILSFWVTMREIYTKRDRNGRSGKSSQFGLKIITELGKIAATDNAYKDAIENVRSEASKAATEAVAQKMTQLMPQLKPYYLSQSGFFNAGRKIFESQDHHSIEETLQNRARKNPGGASEKTLRHFGLK